MEQPFITAEGNHLQLDEREQMFVYQLEVIGLPAVRAAEVSGVSAPYALMKKPHIIAAREQARIAIRGRVNFSREDVIAGFKEAIDQARVLADPFAMIAGWREISKLLGYDKTTNVHLHLNGTVDQMRRQVAGMSSEELMQQIGDSSVLDADFYQVDNPSG